MAQKQLTLREKLDELHSFKTTREKLDYIVEKATPSVLAVAKLQKEIEAELKRHDNPQAVRQYLRDMNGWRAAIGEVSNAANAVEFLAEKEWEAAKGLSKADLIDGKYHDGKKQAVGYADAVKYKYTEEALQIAMDAKFVAGKLGDVKKVCQNYIESLRSELSLLKKEMENA